MRPPAALTPQGIRRLAGRTRWIVMRFPGGATLEIPDDRVDLVRLAIDRMAAQQEVATS